MRDFFKMFFASLLALIIGCVVLVGLTIGLIASLSKAITETRDDKSNMGDVLMIDLSNKIHEGGQSNSLAMFSKGEQYDAGLIDIVRSLNTAKTDASIKGLAIRLNPSPEGWATLQQLRIAVDDFRKSGKFVYAYGENISQGAYFVATAADSIYLNPAGDMELKGLASVMPFFKGTLDKLELQPQIFYAGKFKSATEPFRADRMSEPNKQQIAAMQTGVWNEFLAAAAAYARTTPDAINKLAQEGSIQFPGDALKAHLVAGLLYADEVEQRIKNKTGKKEKDKIKYVSISEYASLNRFGNSGADNKIAVLVAEGEIVDGEGSGDVQIASRTFCEEIRKVRNDDGIKAVVLRVNSPGGSALASEVILRELMLLKAKKHLVVSMGDYAASGGYYISCKADSIFAMPTTITGSIGVFGMSFNIQNLAKNKLGVTFDEVKNAPYADLPTGTRTLTPLEAQRMQASVDTIYNIFKNHVVDGRKLGKAEVDSIAQGRIWTGTDALRLHLVDRIGTLSQAVTSAAALAGIKGYRIVTYPETEDKLNVLLKKLKNNTAANEAVKAAIKEETGDTYNYYDQIKKLKQMNGKALMAMPFVPVIQ
jgi:protease-4